MEQFKHNRQATRISQNKTGEFVVSMCQCVSKKEAESDIEMEKKNKDLVSTLPIPFAVA